MRITQNAIAQTSLLGLNQNLDRVGRLQQQLTSGRLISVPSDSPTGARQAMQIRQDSSAVAQQARNIADGKSWLAVADGALQGMLQQARVVRGLTVQGLNSGASSESSRQAIAAQVTALRESMLGQANQPVNGRPVFGGATTGTVAYDEDGVFVGVGGTAVDAFGVQTDLTVPLVRRISDTQVVRVDVTGPEAFGDPAAGRDLFTIVGDIAGHVLTAGSDPAALEADLVALDSAMNRLLTAVADIGTRAAGMESAEQVNADLRLTLTQQLSGVEEIDLPKTIMELNLQQTGYEAALAATAKAVQLSLVDFLR